MLRFLIGILVLFALTTGYAQQIEIVNFEELNQKIDTKGNHLQVFNFWATWCKPCIEEMPYFEKANGQAGVDVTFVSLDFAEEVSKKVVPFISKKKIKSEVVLLNDIDYNSWIDRVSKDWSGAIPATLFVSQDGSRYFHEGKISNDELDEIISKMNR